MIIIRMWLSPGLPANCVCKHRHGRLQRSSPATQGTGRTVLPRSKNTWRDRANRQWAAIFKNDCAASLSKTKMRPRSLPFAECGTRRVAAGILWPPAIGGWVQIGFTCQLATIDGCRTGKCENA